MGLLYVVYNESIRNSAGELLYKIGITKGTVKDRYYGLGLKMPGEFKTLFAYKLTNYAKAEQSIHGILDQYRDNGEWFSLSNEQLNLIHDICKNMKGVLVNENEKNIIDTTINSKETESENSGVTNRRTIREILENIITSWDKDPNNVKTTGNAYNYRHINIYNKQGKRLRCTNYEFLIREGGIIICLQVYPEKNEKKYFGSQILEKLSKKIPDFKGYKFKYERHPDGQQGNITYNDSLLFTKIQITDIDGAVATMHHLIDNTKEEIINAYIS
jgi:hypothetical protein